MSLCHRFHFFDFSPVWQYRPTYHRSNLASNMGWGVSTFGIRNCNFWMSQVGNRRKIGLNQSIMYIHPFLPCHPKCTHSWLTKLFLGRKNIERWGGGNPPPTLAEIITPSGFVTPPPPTLSSSYSSSSSRVTQKWLQTGTLGLIAHGCKELSLRCHFQVSSGTHPDISAGCKTAVSHHSALSSVEVKNAWHIKWKRKFKLETGGTL